MFLRRENSRDVDKITLWSKFYSVGYVVKPASNQILEKSADWNLVF